MQERIKKEYLKAKAAASGEAAEDTDDEDEQKLSVAGKQMRKMLKKNDKGGQYDDSDEDKNPYASSVCCRLSFPFFRGTHKHVNRRKRMMSPIHLKYIRDPRFRRHRLDQVCSNQLRRATVPPISRTLR